MEYVQGETLEAIIDREKGARRAARAQLRRARSEGRRARARHGDHPPRPAAGERLVSERGLLKVADFGPRASSRSRARHDRHRQPPYMAPEQFQGRAVLASDIYSVGVMIYQMLTGTLPYKTPAPADLEKLMRLELVVPPPIAQPNCNPKASDNIVMKALAPEVTRMYERAAEFLEDLLAVRGPRPRRRSTETHASMRWCCVSQSLGRSPKRWTRSRLGFAPAKRRNLASAGTVASPARAIDPFPFVAKLSRC